MAISFVSYSWALVTEPTGSLWPPSGYQQGDLFIMWGAHPTNSGWTHHFTSDPYQSYRWATSNEPVIYFDSCSWYMVMVACYRGVDHVGDYDWGGGGNFCPVDINDYKATVVRWRWYFSTDPLYFSAPSGYIERAEYYSGGIYIYPFYYNSQIVDRSRGPGSDTGTWPEMAQTHNAIVLEPSALTATLQGVGSLSPIASYRASGGSTLTGV